MVSSLAAESLQSLPLLFVFAGGARIHKLANATPTQRKAFQLINITLPMTLK